MPWGPDLIPAGRMQGANCPYITREDLSMALPGRVERTYQCVHVKSRWAALGSEQEAALGLCFS